MALYKIKDKNSTIGVRPIASKKSNFIKFITGENEIYYNVTEVKDKLWLHIPSLNGWVYNKDTSTGKTLMIRISSKESTSNNNSSSKSKKVVDEESYAYIPDTNIIQVSSDEYVSNLDSHFKISNLRGIFGMPYQFMDSVDPRLTSEPDAIGRKYAKEIVSTMPLLLITPGKPIFMAKFNNEDKQNVLRKFIDVASGHESGIIDTVLSDTFGKYYSLEYAYKEYFEYVNPMCRTAARIMNLHTKTVDGVKLDSYNWMNQANNNFSKLFTVYRGCTAWYCQSESNISESFSNNTTESMIASSINSSISDKAREINFLLGTVNSSTKKGTLLDKFTNADNLTKSMENVTDMIGELLGNNSAGGIFSSITNAALTVAKGGKLVFPQLWSDFSFNRSYSVSLKLVSPDGDPLSIYLNIIVPMLHLLGLVLPREASDNTGHGYISPFLVRAFYKGFFNVDMGIITNLSFSKGTDSAWTLDGLPTTVDVSFEITDLYSDMYMSNMDGRNNLLKNIILMDYISNLCGVNINEVDVFRGIDLYLTQYSNKIPDTWNMKIQGTMDQWISNKWQNLLGRF